MVFDRLRRWLGGAGAPPPEARSPLAGAVRVGSQEWQVREERRAGPWPQLLVLTVAGHPGSEMHVRLAEAEQVSELEEVAPRAVSPSARWFEDASGARWEARIVLADSPPARLVKFVHWPDRVCEGAYPFEDGLGMRTDAELRDMLSRLRHA